MAEEHNSYTQDPESKPTDKLDIALKAFVALSSFYDKIPSVMRLDKPVAAHIYYFQYVSSMFHDYVCCSILNCHPVYTITASTFYSIARLFPGQPLEKEQKSSGLVSTSWSALSQQKP